MILLDHGLRRPDCAYIEKILKVEKQEFCLMFSERLKALDPEFPARGVEPFLFTRTRRGESCILRKHGGNTGRAWNQRKCPAINK